MKKTFELKFVCEHHTQVINTLVDELFGDLPVTEERLEEELGHTLPQVFLGCILAILCRLGCMVVG